MTDAEKLAIATAKCVIVAKFSHSIAKEAIKRSVKAQAIACAVVGVLNPALAAACFLRLAVTTALRYALAATAYAAALKICGLLSPLILDLDGDGVEADALTYFDHEGDGWSELSRWANEDDGVLVWDKNKDGKINDGSELFGDNSVKKDGRKATHGFAALSDIDDNGDGVVDVKDAAWSELKIMRWKDADGDGIKDDGEEYFQTLAQVGVKSLDTGYKDSTKVDKSGNEHRDKSGNEHRQVGSYTKADDSKATMTDFWFVTSTSNTTYDQTGIPTHSAAITSLPELEGSGRLYSLCDAMALDDVKDSGGKSKLKTPYYGDSCTETRSCTCQDIC